MPSIADIREIQPREASPEALLARVEPLLARIQAAPPVDISFVDVLGIPVHLALRCTDLQAARLEARKEWGRLDFFYTHQGKGLTVTQSRLSCIMEAIERYSAGHHPLDGKMVEAAYSQLGEEALDPAAFFLPPGVVYDPDKPLTWFKGTDLISGRPVLAPVDFVLMDIPDSAYPFEGFQSQRLGFFVSNGLAAGARLEQALVSGLCEVVERDAQHRLGKGIPPMPAELSLEQDPDFGPWLDLFQSRGLTLRAFCLDHQPGFYTAVAASWDHYCRLLVLGSACGPRLRPALQQALLELAQQRAFMFFKHWKTHWEYFPIVRYIRERIPPERYRSTVPAAFWTERCRGPMAIDNLGPDFPEDLESLVKALSGRHRVAAFDLTHPNLAVPVVRVLVSGLNNGYLDFQPALSFLEDEPAAASVAD